MTKKIYSCCICHQILTDKKPHRLILQEYATSIYNQYSQVNKFDLCDKHFKIFMSWIKKHSDIKN